MQTSSTVSVPQTRLNVTIKRKSPQNNVTHSRRLWASAGAAGLAEALTMPVDFAKVRMQLQSSHCAVRYSGMVDCMASTLRNEGPRAFFKGLGPGLVRQMGYTGLSLMLYEPIRNGLSPAGRDASYTSRLLAGGTAGGMGISVLNPMEVIKTQIQASSSKTSAADVFARIWRTDGILGFWAGIGPNIARTFLVCAAELGTYDEVKTHLLKSQLFSDGPLAHVLASASAAFASASISTPVDVVKTRLMSQAGSGASTSPQYRGMVDGFVKIASNEGAMSFYKGFVPILTRKVLWCSCFFMTYEHLLTS
mmetsp:Transcript_15665/g.24954  ORF Transcript_15665/g.24954 Transcript_15665/m.24954 type:complete len:307 (-) Transcript_15665:47-967(-)